MKFEIEVYSVSLTQNTYIQNRDRYLTRQMANDSSTSNLFTVRQFSECRITT
jgi:hypothetical protein